jgi:adenosylhomocysteinase
VIPENFDSRRNPGILEIGINLRSMIHMPRHPAAVMDMSFANQALSVVHIARNHAELAADVHRVPPDIDRAVAERKLAAMDVSIDRLTAEQRTYLSSWREGT